MNDFRPMLAKEAEFDLLDFGTRQYYASPKVDGIRAVIIDGEVLSRTLKPIPNLYVQQLFGNKCFNGLDGELVVGTITDEEVYRKTNSGVMRVAGKPDVAFVVFDDITNCEDPYEERLKGLVERTKTQGLVKPLPQQRVMSLDHLDMIEDEYLSFGYEGLMLRDISLPYKFGRSTAKQQHLLKVKRMSDSEALIISFDPMYKNMNEAVTNALGYTERSSHKLNREELPMLGRFKCRDLKTNAIFYVGSGFTHKERKRLWSVRNTLKGQILKYEFFEIGMKDNVPRHPVFKGFRSILDI